ncbi:Sentrin-specific protease 1 [Geodia barretti]|nr:Sentrin-specific protease 1 [Geodia barretti]
MDLVLYPIHLGTHWCLAAIDNRQQSLTYYDSLGGQGKSCLAKLRDYLLSEYRDKKKAELSLNGWRDVPVNVSHYYTEPWNPNENVLSNKDTSSFLKNSSCVQFNRLHTPFLCFCRTFLCKRMVQTVECSHVCMLAACPATLHSPSPR